MQCNSTEISKFSATPFSFLYPLQLIMTKGTLFEGKIQWGISYKERWIHCSSLSSAVTTDMHLLYGTNPFPHASGSTLTFSLDIADVSLALECPTSSNLPSSMEEERRCARMFRGIFSIPRLLEMVCRCLLQIESFRKV